jgi:hypothetical protein
MSLFKSIGRTAKRVGVGLIASTLPGGSLATKALGDVTSIIAGKNRVKSVTVSGGSDGIASFDMVTGADVIRASNARNTLFIGAAVVAGAFILLRK